MKRLPKDPPRPRSKRELKKGPPGADPRKRRSPRGERNRKRLLDAAIAVLLGEGGLSKFTSTHIAEAAGLRKPAFYAHFKNVDECMHAVVSELARADVQELLDLYKQAMPSLPLTLDVRERINERVLLMVRQNESIYRLVLRYRFSEGALGEAIRGIYNFLLERWVEYFWRVAVHLQVDPRHFKELEHLAEFEVSMHYTAFDRVLAGRASDVRAEAVRLARYGHELAEAEFKRMLKATPPR